MGRHIATVTVPIYASDSVFRCCVFNRLPSTVYILCSPRMSLLGAPLRESASDALRLFPLKYCHWCREGATGWASDLQSRGREFDSLSTHGCCVTTLGKLFTPMCPLSPNNII